LLHSVQECEYLVRQPEDESTLMFDFTTNEWHLRNASEGCEELVETLSLGHWKDEHLFQTVFCVIKNPSLVVSDANRQLMRSIATVSQLNSISDTLKSADICEVDCRTRVGKIAEHGDVDLRTRVGTHESAENCDTNDVVFSNKEQSDKIAKSIFTLDRIPSLDSIISSDPLKFDYDKVASLNDNKVPILDGFHRLFSKTIESCEMKTPDNIEERSDSTSTDPGKQICEKRPYYCHVSLCYLHLINLFKLFDL